MTTSDIPLLNVSTYRVASESDGRVVLYVGGKLDVATAEDLRAALMEALEFGRPLAIDLSDVVFVDSSAIRELLRADAHAAANGGSVVVVRASPAVRRVFEFTNVTQLLGD